MLKVLMGAINSNQTAIIEEGSSSYAYGGKMTKEDIEKSLHLPIGYNVGYKTQDQNFWYKVVEM